MQSPVAEEYRVSPYLREVAFRTEGHDLGVPCKLLYDGLNRRQVFISAASYDVLSRANSRGGILLEHDLLALRDELPFLTKTAIVLPTKDAFRLHNYQSIEIEINRHCNYRCDFCPVSTSPKPKGLMSRELFRQVLARVVEYGVKIISLNHYSEPTLHPEFVEFCELAAAHSLAIRLHSNLSMLDEAKIAALVRANCLAVVIANVPSVRPDHFREITRSKHYDKVMRNIVLLRDAGVKVRLSVNATLDNALDEVREINDRFQTILGPQRTWETDDRAGQVQSGAKYRLPVHNSGRLTGCDLALWQINISYDGQVFLCCQDFDQKHVVGDITKLSLAEIAEGPDMVALRRQIFGDTSPNGGLLCTRCHKTSVYSPDRPFAVGASGPRRELRTPVEASKPLVDAVASE